MRFNVIFKLKNPKFSKDYANEYHFGKESIDNQKDIFSKTYQLTADVKEYSITESGEFNLRGTLENGKKIHEQIPDMHILKCFDEENNEIGIFGVSLELLEKSHKAFNKKHNITRYYYYLKAGVNFEELIDGVFVTVQDIPKILTIK